MPTRRFRASSKPLHPTRWCSRDEIALTQAAAGQTLTELCTAAELSVFTNPTVVRIRGVLYSTLSFTQNTSTSQVLVAHGIIVVDDDVVSTDSLFTQEGLERPWLWLDYYHGVTEQMPAVTFTSAGAVTTDFVRMGGRASNRFVIDVKAKRRIPPGSKLALVTQFNDLSGSPDVAHRGIIRSLIKE